MAGITYILHLRKPCNIRFVWDDVGPGLEITWSSDGSLVGTVLRDTDMPADQFAYFTELLA